MNRRYQALDGLRGLAAIIVALVHTPFRSAICDLPLIRNGSLFVDFFFVLSGFVLTHAHLNKRDTFRSFFIKRLGRLWPLHIVMLTAFVLLEGVKFLMSRHGVSLDEPAFIGEHSPAAIITGAFLIQALGVHTMNTWNCPSWSISTEMWVSMLFIVLVITLRNRLRTAAALVAGASAFLLFWVSPDMMDEVYKWAFFRCCFGFFTGVVLYLSIRQASAETGRKLEWPFLLLVILFVWFHQPGFTSLLAPLVFAGFIYVFAGEGGRLSGWLKTPVAQWCGERSYSIYMTNFFVGMVLWRVFKVLGKLTHHQLNEQIAGGGGKIYFGGPVLMGLGVLFYLSLVFLLSAFTYAMIEVPWRRRFNRLAEKERVKDSAPVLQPASEVPVA
jgi:peptidoglycan/LPS O-acetylase OafA/YrhL